ncbi:hypothetical protein OROHE_022919 [Orobanche hederae]
MDSEINPLLGSKFSFEILSSNSSLFSSLCMPESTMVVPGTPNLAKSLIGSDHTTLDFVDSLVGSEVTTVDLFNSGVYYTRKVEWSEEMEKQYLCFLGIWCPTVLQIL